MDLNSKQYKLSLNLFYHITSLKPHGLGRIDTRDELRGHYEDKYREYEHCNVDYQEERPVKLYRHTIQIVVGRIKRNQFRELLYRT